MLVLGAAAAGPAFAAEAKWSPPGQVQAVGDVTLKLNGGSAIECDNLSVAGPASGTYLITGAELNSCSGSSFGFQLASIAASSGSAYSITNYLNGNAAVSPYGTYLRSVWTAPVVNGNALTPTRLVFNETAIGRRQADNLPITMTGTLDVTRVPGGGLITLK